MARERKRLRAEIKKSQEQERSLIPNKVCIRIGGGLTGNDTSINTLAWGLKKAFYGNWNAKLDILYKFYGLERGLDGRWEKAHTWGLFLNGGNQTGSNLSRIFPESKSDEVDKKSINPFYEAELGIMLREEFRISGGIGMTQWSSNLSGENRLNRTYYGTFTAGLSPRLFSFLELDFLFSGTVLEKEIRPRATINAVILFQTWKK